MVEELISKYINRTISGPELEILKDHISRNKDLRDQLIKRVALAKKANIAHQMSLLDLEASWQTLDESAGKSTNKSTDKSTNKSINKSTGKRRPIYIQILKYAAIALILFTTGLLLFIQNKNQPDGFSITALSSEIKSGNSKATLYLSDNKQIDLAQQFSGQISNGITINNQSGKLTYSKPERSRIKPSINNLYTPKGGEFVLELSDGTKIWLNSDTRIQFPTCFTGTEREVELWGEAYFEIAPDPGKVFIVKTGSLEIHALGTAFNVKSYAGDNNIETTLTSGIVRLCSQNETVDLSPGQQGVLDKSARQILLHDVNVYDYTAWKDGVFVFKNMALEDIMKTFERWFDVKVRYDDPAAKELRFTGMLDKYEEIYPHLDLISLTTAIEFDINGDSITVIRKNAANR